jgi:hypothetical protein
MARAALSWFWDVCLRALPGPVISEKAFEDKVQHKTLFLKPLSIVRLCAEGKVLEDHLNHNPLSVPSVPDLVTLVALTRLLFEQHLVEDLERYAQATGYLNCYNLYRQQSEQKHTDTTLSFWPEKVLNALQAKLIQTLEDNPKAFLIGWQPSEILLHQVCLETLETTDGLILMNLYHWLLTRLTDLFSGKASVKEGDPNPQDLWQSIADTQEMLDTVQGIWLKNPLIPVDYCDYLKTHNIFEKKEFFTSRADIFRSLMEKA